MSIQFQDLPIFSPLKKALIFLMALLFVHVLSGCNHNPTNEEKVNQLKENGVSIFDSVQTQKGLTLIDRVSDGEFKSTLIDLNGNILKEYPCWLVKFLNDGSILGKRDSFLMKFDSDLNIVWKTKVYMEPHHEITVDSAGNIYTFTCDVHPFMGLDVKFDGIQMLSPDGELLKRWCVYDHLEEFVSVISKSQWTKHLTKSFSELKNIESYILQDPENFIFPANAKCDCLFEFTHFNAMQVISDDKLFNTYPAFKKGNLLVSFHPFSCYGIIDINVGRIEWVGYLPERTKLHSVTLTPENTILVFENSTDSLGWMSKNSSNIDSLRRIFLSNFPNTCYAPIPKGRMWTSVSEYNPFTNEKLWEYTAKPKESMMANSKGSIQRLANENMLICATFEEKGGKVFEINTKNEIVWEYSFPQNDSVSGKPWSFYRAKRIDTEIANSIANRISSK